MTPRINDGTRPSRLDLGRDRAGECALPAAARELPTSQAWAEQVDAARPPSLDVDALRLYAASLSDEPANFGPMSPPGAGVEHAPGPVRWAGWLGVALAAAAAAFFLLPSGSTLEAPNRVKGEAELDFVLLRDGQPVAGEATTVVHAGDVIQFTYRGTSDQLVLVGVDATGRVMAYHPDEGETPVAVTPGERQLLDGAILLDDAPGPEVFVAHFGGTRVSDVKALVRSEYQEGGIDAVRALDAERADIAILVLDKE